MCWRGSFLRCWHGLAPLDTGPVMAWPRLQNPRVCHQGRALRHFRPRALSGSAFDRSRDFIEWQKRPVLPCNGVSAQFIVPLGPVCIGWRLLAFISVWEGEGWGSALRAWQLCRHMENVAEGHTVDNDTGNDDRDTSVYVAHRWQWQTVMTHWWQIYLNIVTRDFTCDVRGIWRPELRS